MCCQWFSLGESSFWRCTSGHRWFIKLIFKMYANGRLVQHLQPSNGYLQLDFFLKRTSNSCLGFLNILRISASNVLRMFFNITVSNGCAFLIFHSHKPTGRIKTLNYQFYNIYISISIICYPGRQKSNKVVNKKDLKTKFYMHNTIKAMLHWGILTKEQIFPWFCAVYKWKSFAFPQPPICSQHVLKFWAFLILSSTSISRCGIKGSSHKLFQQYFNNWTQKCVANGSLSVNRAAVYHMEIFKILCCFYFTSINYQIWPNCLSNIYRWPAHPTFQASNLDPELSQQIDHWWQIYLCDENRIYDNWITAKTKNSLKNFHSYQ